VTTLIFEGSFTFASLKTVWIDWAITGGTPGGGPSGGVTPSIFVDMKSPMSVGSFYQGETRQFNVTFVWTGSASVTVLKVVFKGENLDWFSLDESLPFTITRSASETYGLGVVSVLIRVPSNTKLDSYVIGVEVTLTIPPSTAQTIVSTQLQYNIVSTVGLPTSIPELMTPLLLVGIVGLIGFMVTRKRRNH